MKISNLVFGVLGYVAVSCVGSSQSASQVPVTQLIDNPNQYNNKTISTVGYYWFDGHAPVLTTDAKTAQNSPRAGSTIFLDLRNSPSIRSSLEKIRAGYVSITGTFQYRNMKVTQGKEFDYIVPGFGWMNDYERQITNIKSVAIKSLQKQ